MRSTPRALAVVAVVQAVLTAALTVLVLGVFGLGLLFAVGDTPAGAAGRREVTGYLVVLGAAVLVPLLLTAMLLWAGLHVGRPRAAAALLLAAECGTALFVLWPSLRGYLFGLPPSAAVATLDLVLAVPAVLVAVGTLASDGADSGLPDPRRAGAAPPAARRH